MSVVWTGLLRRTLAVACFAGALVQPPGYASATMRHVPPGDVNADGHSDLVVGAPGEDVHGKHGAGKAWVIFGASSGPSRKDLVLSASSAGQPAENLASLGSTVVTGDFNGDGYADVAIGSPVSNRGAQGQGQVLVFVGGPNGFNFSASERLGLRTYGGDQTGAGFGWSMAAGDFNNDGYADLAVGAPSAQPMSPTADGVPAPPGFPSGGNGHVTVFYGSGAGLNRIADFDENTAGMPVSSSSGSADRFGDALAAGDFDHDGSVDLAIGIPRLQVGSAEQAGAVVTLYGGSNGLSTDRAQLWDLNSPGVAGTSSSVNDEDETYGDRYGAALTSGDFDGDGFADLAVGIPDKDVLRGAVSVLYGQASGLSNRNQYLTAHTIRLQGRANSYAFGGSLAAGDFNHDGRDDLAIGIPSASTDGRTAAGEVAVVTGDVRGLDLRTSTAYRQSTAGIGGATEAHAQFGSSLLALDLGNGRATDLIIGTPYQRTKNAPRCGLIDILFGSTQGLTTDNTIAISEDSPGIQGQRQPLDQFGHVGANLRRVDRAGRTR